MTACEIFVQRELRFSDGRIFQWMQDHYLVPQKYDENFHLDYCPIFPEKLLPPPWYFRTSQRCRSFLRAFRLGLLTFEKWALSHWGFNEADCTCSFIRFHEGEYTLEFTTFGKVDAPWFTLLSERLERDIPGAAFTVESHGDDGFSRGNLCFYQGGIRTEMEAWEKEFQQFSLKLILPGKLDVFFSQWNMVLIRRIGGSKRNLESMKHWKVGNARSPDEVPRKEDLGFSNCRDALADFMRKHYPTGAEGLLVEDWPVLTSSGEIDMENLEFALTWNRPEEEQCGSMA